MSKPYPMDSNLIFPTSCLQRSMLSKICFWRDIGPMRSMRQMTGYLLTGETRMHQAVSLKRFGQVWRWLTSIWGVSTVLYTVYGHTRTGVILGMAVPIPYSDFKTYVRYGTGVYTAVYERGTYRNIRVQHIVLYSPQCHRPFIMHQNVSWMSKCPHYSNVQCEHDTKWQPCKSRLRC